MSNIGVFIEIIDGVLKKVNHEALSLARKSGKDIYAITISDELASHKDQLKGLKGIIQIPVKLTENKPDQFAVTLVEIIKKYEINDLIAGYTSVSRDLFPRVSAKIDGSLINDCIEIDLENRIAVKPVYAGKLLQEYKLEDEFNLFTIRSNVFPVDTEADGQDSPIETVELQDTETLTDVYEVTKDDSGHIDVIDAEIIVSGGRGIGSRENFDHLFDLAKVIKAGVGASRAAVDAEYATPNMQVGQTGKVVNPKLYIAFGISGAIQHFVGMKTSKVIVAINKDPDAPIFKKADYGIVGDLFSVIPILKEELIQVQNS